MAGNIGQLNVRIGAETKAFERAVRQMERTMQATADRMALMGNRLSLAFTLPFAGFGAAAIKAAGEAESMRKAMETTMTAAGYSIQQSREELEKLRDAAKAPGLDFEQAVKGSVRLQNVGFAADKAREILVQLANAVSMSGGSAQELDGVTRQFGQMVAKGRVLQEDLTIIQENMPAVSQAMEKAFGTKSAEKLREMGVNAEQFVDGITKQLALLPRVSGGIQNSIVNAGVAMKQALATVGETINETFNVSGNLDRFGDWLTGIADGFKNASAATKTLTIATALLATGIGPAIRAAGLLYTAIETVRIAAIRMRGALLLASGAGLVAAFVAVTAVAVALSDSFDGARFATDQFAKASANVASETAKETAALNANFATLKSSTAGTEAKRAAVDALLRQYPQYLGGMDLEKMSVAELTRLQAGLNAQIMRGVAERQKTAAVTAIYEEQAKMLLRIQQIRDGAAVTPGEAKMIDTGDMIREGGVAAAVLKEMEARQKALGEQATKSAAEFDRAFDLQKGAVTKTAAAVVQSTAAVEGSREAYENERDSIGEVVRQQNDLWRIRYDNTAETKRGTKAAKDAAKAYKEEADAIAKRFGGMQPLDARNTSEVSTGGGGIGDTLSNVLGANALKVATDIPAVLTPAQAAIQSLTDGVSSLKEVWEDMSNSVMAGGTLVQKATMQAGEAMMQYADQGGTSFREMAQAALGAAAKIVRSFIMQGVAAAAAKALASVPFPLNLALAAGAGAAAGTLFNRLISSIGIPALAEGGAAYGPTLAMIGDNPGASIDPEVVAPLSKLQNMIGGSGGGGRLVAEVSGESLLFVVDRARDNRSRITGRR
jgi:tape measure domain-containing protein